MKNTSWSLLAVLLVLGGCTQPMAVDPDPATSLGEEDWVDEGPLPEDDQPIEDTSDPSVATEELTTTGSFELPFPCGQVWAGQTRSGHSPQLSIDFNRANDIGDSVVAAAGGTVTRVENLGSRSYGRWVEIDHGNGYRTRYAHLHTQAVRVGQRVSRGERIGAVGDTGGSTGPHLHFELRRNGVAIRPVFHGGTAVFYATRNYTSHNSCSGSSGGSTGGGSGVSGRVNTSGAPLTIRASASTSGRAVGSVPDGGTVRITCQRRGTSVRGTYGTSTLWDYVGTGYVSDAYISTGSDGQVAPTCR